MTYFKIVYDDEQNRHHTHIVYNLIDVDRICRPLRKRKIRPTRTKCEKSITCEVVETTF